VRTSPRLRKSFFVPEFREFERREKHRRNFGLTPNENPADRRSDPSEEDVSMMRPRVLLADDHTLLLEAFQRLLADEC
jgi:hypothetical protein